MKILSFFLILPFFFSPSLFADGRFSPLDSFHNNNNLWTGFDPLNGDIGNRENSSLEFLGGSSLDHILRGCHAIGFITSAGDTVVVSNKPC